MRWRPSTTGTRCPAPRRWRRRARVAYVGQHGLVLQRQPGACRHADACLGWGAQLWLPEHAPDGSLVLNTQARWRPGACIAPARALRAPAACARAPRGPARACAACAALAHRVAARAQGLPFSVSGCGDLLALFRCISCRYKFSTDMTKLNTVRGAAAAPAVLRRRGICAAPRPPRADPGGRAQGAVGRVFVSGEVSARSLPRACQRRRARVCGPGA